MIQLKPFPKPSQLTDELVAKLTQEFKDNGKRVWNKNFIKKALLKMSYDKCCYCESGVNLQHPNVEVEHFLPKSLYPDSVVIWDNLLPSCKRCNGNKQNLDTLTELIIHPLNDNPQEHLLLKDYHLYKRNNSEKGQRTIDKIRLNEMQRLVKKRFEIEDTLKEATKDLLEKTEDYIKKIKFTDTQKEKIIHTLEKLMNEGKPESDFSATAATVMLTDENYLRVKNLFQQHNLWTRSFEESEQVLQNASLA
jgi:uncharacterized protein (TIGR02646 family)